MWQIESDECPRSARAIAALGAANGWEVVCVASDTLPDKPATSVRMRRQEQRLYGMWYANAWAGGGSYRWPWHLPRLADLKARILEEA